MNQAFWTDERVAGSLLVAGLLIGLLAVVIMIARGAAPGFAAVGGALELMAPYADRFRLLNGMYAAAWVFLLLGFALFARLLAQAGDEQLAILAFTLALTTGVTGVLHGAFHAGLRTWAAEEAARTGNIPEIYQPLRAWADGAFRLGYAGSFIAMALASWGILLVLSALLALDGDVGTRGCLHGFGSHLHAARKGRQRLRSCHPGFRCGGSGGDAAVPQGADGLR